MSALAATPDFVVDMIRERTKDVVSTPYFRASSPSLPADLTDDVALAAWMREEVTEHVNGMPVRVCDHCLNVTAHITCRVYSIRIGQGCVVFIWYACASSVCLQAISEAQIQFAHQGDMENGSVLVANTCHVCLKISKTIKRCTVCKSRFYCTRDCQIKDWPTHRLVCRALK